MARRFGIFLSAQHPPAMAPSQIVRDCCEQVRLARTLGFDDVSAGQHFLTQPYQMLQLVPLLARIAADAGEMRVCSGIILLTLLNPVEVAENAATLDAITDGRFVLGLGLGYRQQENDAFALPARRLSIFEQKVDVVRRLLEGEVVTAEGHGFKLERQRLAIRPVQYAVRFRLRRTNRCCILRTACSRTRRARNSPAASAGSRARSRWCRKRD
jgi:alkanesulfonate monooxygenase SsuD/methylene tetrahydromethanopterin reductase-like flavin-dependent oxidoreductase (luciferase family)